MLHRSLLLFLVAVALAMFVSQSVFAEDKPHEGIVVTAGDGKLTMTMMDGQKKHSHDVAKDAKVTLDGKTAKLEDLKEGFHITVTTTDKNVATKIEAKSKAK